MEMFALSLLLLFQVFANAKPVECELCSKGFAPGDPLTVIVFNGEFLSCQEVHEKGVVKVGNLDECSFLKNLGRFQCKCEKVVSINPTPSGCKLCQDGSRLPNPNSRPWPTFTCAELQSNAGRNNVCKLYQGTIGPYCGCKNNTVPASVCRLCGKSNLLPRPKDKTENGISCLEREFLATLSGSCATSRTMYSKDCCDLGTNLPTRKPVKRSPNPKSVSPTKKRLPTKTPTKGN
jgi:hypothetical protein